MNSGNDCTLQGKHASVMGDDFFSREMVAPRYALEVHAKD